MLMGATSIIKGANIEPQFYSVVFRKQKINRILPVKPYCRLIKLFIQKQHKEIVNNVLKKIFAISYNVMYMFKCVWLVNYSYLKTVEKFVVTFFLFQVAAFHVKLNFAQVLFPFFLRKR